MDKKNRIVFEPIPAGDGIHFTSLGICPSGSWIGDNEDFVIFLGGSAIGRAPTLEAAKKMLTDAAINFCKTSQIVAKESLDHYTKMHSQIVLNGLVELKKK